MTRGAPAGTTTAERKGTNSKLPAAGFTGRHSISVGTETDDRVTRLTQELLERARELRPLLREQQAETEERGHYSQEVHEYFIEHGFYRTLQPRRFGGLELTVSAFFQVIAEVARGCPSTAWCLSLSTGHSLTLGSFWGEQAQSEIFEEHGHLVAPSSGNASDLIVKRVEGGYLVSGTWRYCSGSPYSTHFMPSLDLENEDGELAKYWAVIPRSQYTVLDDWGRIMGMRGSGSNGISMEKAFVPFHLLSLQDWSHHVAGESAGSLLHGNPIYAGPFYGFAEGEVAATSVGLGYAALDAYEDILHNSRHPYVKDGSTRSEHSEWQRIYGTSLARIDAAAATLNQGGRLFRELAVRSTKGLEPFDSVQTMRLNNMYLVVEQLVWEAVEDMVRTAGSSASVDGHPLQRYYRDITTTRSRTDQLALHAVQTSKSYFENRLNTEAI